MVFFSNKNIISRILLYQVMFYYSIKALMDKSSYKDIRYKFNNLLISLGFEIDNFYLITTDTNLFFYNLIIIIILIFGILSICNVKISQFLSGIFILSFNFVINNPIERINELKSRHIVLDTFNFEEYLPNRNFCLLITIGIAMIGQSLENITFCDFNCDI